MRIFLTISIIAYYLFIAPFSASAHFGMIIPSHDIVSQQEGPTISLRVMFVHPFEDVWMDMDKPSKYGVIYKGKREKDLLSTLQPVETKGKKAWQSTFKTRRPGDYIFYMEPKPYWELTEDKFIVHYTKVVVNAYGLEEGWDAEIGLKTEIVPLTRPYGLYTGNVFRGLVKVDGRPAPFSEVEVEYYNENNRYKAPKASFVTQVIKADQNGVFTYAVPWAGWWGFAALNEDAKKIKRKGKDYPVEIGAVMWLRVYDIIDK